MITCPTEMAYSAMVTVQNHCYAHLFDYSTVQNIV